jgi:hypothetical protein
MPSPPKKPNWGKLYERHFPDNTDGASRHVICISEDLRSKRSRVRKLLIEHGYDPDHWAQSMETTVIKLWAIQEKHKGGA